MKWGASLSRPSHGWLLLATMVKKADFPEYSVAIEEGYHVPIMLSMCLMFHIVRWVLDDRSSLLWSHTFLISQFSRPVPIALFHFLTSIVVYM